MYIAGTNQLGGFDVIPDAKVNTAVIFSNHPAEVHDQPLAGGLPFRGGNMLPASGRSIRGVEEMVLKPDQSFFYRGSILNKKNFFQGTVVGVNPVKGLHKIESIGGIEGTVFKVKESFKVALSVMKDKVMGTVIHDVHELIAFVNDRYPLAPSQNRSEEPGDFNVLLFGKPVGNRNGVISNKAGTIIGLYLLVKKSLEVSKILFRHNRAGLDRIKKFLSKGNTYKEESFRIDPPSLPLTLDFPFKYETFC